MWSLSLEIDRISLTHLPKGLIDLNMIPLHWRIWMGTKTLLAGSVANAAPNHPLLHSLTSTRRPRRTRLSMTTHRTGNKRALKIPTSWLLHSRRRAPCLTTRDTNSETSSLYHQIAGKSSKTGQRRTIGTTRLNPVNNSTDFINLLIILNNNHYSIKMSLHPTATIYQAIPASSAGFSESLELYYKIGDTSALPEWHGNLLLKTENGLPESGEINMGFLLKL